MKPIEVEDLCYSVRHHFWSPAKPILQGVSFAVEQGEIFGFLGPNGAGKTTTIKSLLNLLRPDRGAVKILGHSPAQDWVRGHIGYMPEQPYFPTHLTAEELVATHAMLAGINPSQAKHRSLQSLERVGLKGVENQRLSTFSKGMLQRAGLAQALVASPELVILDEPMSGLDPLGRRDVRELLVDLRRQGVTVFFSTHILPDVEMICDRVGILIEGRIRQTGPLAELLGAQTQNGSLEDLFVRTAANTQEGDRP